MTIYDKHISICICTYKRPQLLKRLLEALTVQKTEGLFNYSIVVADNDYMKSAQTIVSDFVKDSLVSVKYCVEPEKNIALARNKALENATGDFIAFIDDDEIPTIEWLFHLFMTCNAYGVDGVLGPVVPDFECKPPIWVIKGKIFERPVYKTGYIMKWNETRTGNVLFKKRIINGIKDIFRPQFGTGSEDVDFFRRMMKKGSVFIWCNEAVVYEAIPETRCTRSYLIKMGLLRGGNSIKHGEGKVRNLMKSLIAIPLYGMAIPILCIVGSYNFMKYLIKFCDHLGRILELFGLNPVSKRNF